MKHWIFLGGWLLSVGVQATDVFTFASFTFDQRNGPETARLLGNALTNGGAIFSAGAPRVVTSSLNFPQGGTGFQTHRSLGMLTGLATNGTRAVNLPDGNLGSAIRHGIELGWPVNYGVPNATGSDLVIYESGSASVEGVMARVRFARDPEAWSDWHYFPPAAYQTLAGAEVAFAYAFDFTDMGVPPVALVDVVQMANLTSTDRIVSTNPVSAGTNLVGAGRVVFDNSTNVKPDAGTNDTDRVFDSTTYDPDPLYVASLHSVVEILPPVLSITNTGGSIRVTWPLLSLLELQTTTALNGAGTLWEPVTNTDVGTNQITTTLGLTNAGRYFRLHRPW